MLILTSWLKEFVSFDVPVDTLAEDLTLAGLEVEGVESAYKGLEPVVVAKVLEVRPHPNASFLKICTLDAGSDSRVEVVCGAPNMIKGQLVALARPGTVLPDGTRVQVAKIHGVESPGMLCSQAELGLGEDRAGIMILDASKGARPGESIVEALELDDWILEIGITPNRPDCLSVIGIAREVAAIYGLPMISLPRAGIAPEEYSAPKEDVPISIEAPDLCRRYAAGIVRDVDIAPSPVWLARRLLASGIRPINNVVDVTNYVLLERGQPLHAFDLDRLDGPELNVRLARSGEEIVTLDGKLRGLSPEILVIADRDRPVAVAGVMGGANSEVTGRTRNILLESAWFFPGQVRRAAKILKAPTEASYRFERGVDPEGVLVALHRALDLLDRIAGGRRDEVKDLYVKPFDSVYIELRPEKVNRLLGTRIEPDEMVSILSRIGMDVREDDSASLRAKAPSYRLDLKEEIDLVEEVARLHGFSRIPSRSPEARLISMPSEPEKVFADRIKGILACQGLDEIISYSFVSPEEIEALRFEEKDPRSRWVKIKNPLSEDQSVLRTSLLSSLLGAVSRNLARRNLDLRLFELGTCFLEQGKEKQPVEEQRVAGIWTGSRYPESWAWPGQPADFFDLKGVVEALLMRLGVDSFRFRPGTPDDPFYVPGAGVSILSQDGATIGTMGQVLPETLSRWDIDTPVFAFDLALKGLMDISCDTVRFKPLAKFPSIGIDNAIIVSDSVYYQEIFEFIRSNGHEFLESVNVFDVYSGKPIPENFKSLGIRFVYRAPDHTLSDKEVAEIHNPLLRKVLESFHGELRALKNDGIDLNQEGNRRENKPGTWIFGEDEPKIS